MPVIETSPYAKRDTWLAWIVNNVVLRFASEQYRKVLEGTFQYGLAAAARDHYMKIPDPPPYEVWGDKDAHDKLPMNSPQHLRWVWLAGATPPHWEQMGTGVHL